MEEKLNKLEFMLVGLRQMNLASVCTYFAGERREDIVAAIKKSSKFKIEGDIVSLKTDSERYEEELQRDILKDLIGENDVNDGDDDLLGDLDDFDTDLELKESIIDQSDIIDIKEPIVDDLTNVQDVEVEPVIQEVTISENKVNNEYKSTVQAVKEEPKKVNSSMKNEQVSIDDIKGSDLNYETILRLINEYNSNIEQQLNYSVESRYEMREKAIKTFYENKYNVKLKEKDIFNTKTNIYALINRKRGMEAAYLLVCERLTDVVLNYMLDHYDDEVVYFCPIDGVDVDFEVGLNEFYLKDTDIIFDRYLEHYEVIEESDISVKKLEIIVGSH